MTDFNQTVLDMFQSNYNYSLLKQELLKMFPGEVCRSFILKNFHNLFDNFDTSYFIYSHPIINPHSTTSPGNSSTGRIYPNRGPAHSNHEGYGDLYIQLDSLNDDFIRDRADFLSKHFERSPEYHYVIRDSDKPKRHDPIIRYVGKDTGKVQGVTDGNCKQPLWRYAEDQTDVKNWSYPQRNMPTRDDSAGNHEEQRMGSKSNGRPQRTTYDSIQAHDMNPYKNTKVEDVEPVHTWSENDEYHQSIHMQQFYADPKMQQLNDNVLWEGSTKYLSNNPNSSKSHHGTVKSFRSDTYRTPRNVFRNNNKLHEWHRRRNYETDVDENLGGFEYGHMLRKHDTSSLHCRISEKPCGESRNRKYKPFRIY